MPGVLAKIREELLYSTVIFDDAGHIRKQVDEDNRSVAVIWSVVEAAFWLFCLAVSFGDPAFERCRELYVAAIALTAVTFVLAVFVVPRMPNLTRPLVFAMQVILLGAGIGLIFYQWDVRSATFIATVLIVPVMFLTDTLQTLVCVAVGVFIVVITGSSYVEPEVYSWTVKTLGIFSIAGVLIGHVINKSRFERYAFEESALELAELRRTYAYYDQLTGLRNRRAFSERVEELDKNMPTTCCVVSADVNGLKQTNDTHGHSAGDELLIGAARCLLTCFENVGEVYRLGGDEFCVIAMENEHDIAQRLLQMEQLAASWKSPLIDGVSISYGVATVYEGQDIDTTLKVADRKMYEHKRNYYASSDRDRRHPPDSAL